MRDEGRIKNTLEITTMTSINLNNTQQAVALQLFQILCAYPESRLSQEFQKLAQSVPNSGQTEIGGLEPLNAFFQTQGVDIEDFIDVAESLFESPEVWASFDNHCEYILMTSDAGTDIPNLPGGRVAFNRTPDSQYPGNDGYTITYTAPDGSTTPLYFVQGRLVSELEQDNPAISLQTLFAPNSIVAQVSAGVRAVLFGNVYGQQAIGMNADETGSDDETFWGGKWQFIKDHWVGITVGLTCGVGFVLVIIGTVKFVRYALRKMDEAAIKKRRNRKIREIKLKHPLELGSIEEILLEEEDDLQNINDQPNLVHDDLPNPQDQGQFENPVQEQHEDEPPLEPVEHPQNELKPPDWRNIKDKFLKSIIKDMSKGIQKGTLVGTHATVVSRYFNGEIINNDEYHQFLAQIDEPLKIQVEIDSLSGVLRNEEFIASQAKQKARTEATTANKKSDIYKKALKKETDELNKLRNIKTEQKILGLLDPFKPQSKEALNKIKKNKAQYQTKEVKVLQDQRNEELNKLLLQQQQISELQQIANTPETRELMVENQMNYNLLSSLNPYDPKAFEAGIVKVNIGYEKTNTSVKALQQAEGISIESQNRHSQLPHKLSEKTHSSEDDISEIFDDEHPMK